MPILKDFVTIPDIFYYLTEEYGKTTAKPLMYHKSENNWVSISYPEFKESTHQLSAGLSSLGVKRGDKVALIAENGPKWIFSDLAILSLGAVNVPLYPSLTADNIEYILNNSETVGIIVSNKFQLTKVLKIKDKCKHLRFIIVMVDQDAVAGDPMIYSFTNVQKRGEKFLRENPKLIYDAISLCRPDDLCTIIYTSGTTGEPKGVMLTHKNIISNVNAALKCFPIGETDTFLSFLPLCHIFERMAGYYTVFASGSTVYFAQSIESVASDLMEVKPTIMTAVPRLFERIYSKVLKNIQSQPQKKQKIFEWAVETGKSYCEQKRNGSVSPALAIKQKLADILVLSKIRARTGGKLRFFISGGAALPRDLGEFFEALGVIIIEGYGLTESSPVIAANRLDGYKFGTVGKPFPGVDVKIAHDGEILARGANIMLGYYKNKKETEETIKDGWLHTGDIGVFDAEGYLMITDRKKHLFKTSAGKYIAPTPIENMFLSSRFIDQFVLIGDRRMFLSALIVPDFEALREYADSHSINYRDNADLIKNKDIYDMMERELITFSRRLANFERVRKFALLEKPFALETGEMTPSLKLKRKVIEERYRHLIEEMYLEMQ
ncbi:MAG: long-chain fatty acid--CoA ligase [Ignavibacteriaceae bacterium]|nr:long-chain fatty acid--CoA ligase [Ignavibacteriaceae bacterium]